MLSPSCRCHMIDVNHGEMQGDAHLIQADGGRTVLIDAGPAIYAEPRLLPFLRRAGVERLDAIFVTHPHFDHYEGVRNILDAGMPVAQLFMNPVDASWYEREWWGGNAAAVEAILRQAEDRGVQILPHSEWREFELSECVVLEQYQCLTEADFRRLNLEGDLNDMSLVAVLRQCGKPKIFYPGDINVASGNVLAADPRLDFTCDIVKFPHHGAESFGGMQVIEKLQPKAMLFPAPPSIWGTPRCAAALELPARLGADVHANADSGHVQVSLFDNGQWQIRGKQSAAVPRSLVTDVSR